jgi:hypothetical protein
LKIANRCSKRETKTKKKRYDNIGEIACDRENELFLEIFQMILKKKGKRKVCFTQPRKLNDENAKNKA